jgi:hypothetical protein
MKKYKCYRCGYEVLQKNDIKKHLNRKKICDTIFMNVSIEEALNLLNEKNKDVLNDFIIKQLEDKNKEIEELKKQLEEKNNNTETNNTINGDNGVIDYSTNYNINIQVNSYDKTDYSVIKDKIKTCILKDGSVDEVKLVKLLHFNKEYPENQNVKLENTKTNKILTYDGENFVSSKYIGKENLWTFAKDTFDKTSKEEFVIDDDKTFDAVETTKDIHKSMKRPSKLNKANELQSFLENSKLVKE